MVQGSEAKKIAQKIYRNVSKILNHPKTWAAAKAIAEALLTYNYLDHDAAFKIVSKIRPPQPPHEFRL
jgi:hypothetical protein